MRSGCRRVKSSIVRRRRTPVKTRVMAGGYQATRQQVVRIDREPVTGPHPATDDALVERVSTLAARADAVIISDYGYGAVTSRVLERLRQCLDGLGVGR